MSIQHQLDRRMNCARRFLPTLAIVAALISVQPLLAADKTPDQLVAEARQAVEADPAKALKLLDEAARVLPDSPEIAYNRGVVHYRQGDYEKATESFTRSLATRDLALDARARFNLGNCAYAEALAEQGEAESAVEKLKSAVSYYRQALETDPADSASRANIERAQLLIKHLLDQEKQRQEQQQQQKDKQGDDQKPPTSQPSSQPQDSPQSQPSDEQQSQQKQSQQGQKDAKKQEQSQQKGEQDQKQQSAEQQAAEQKQAQDGKLEQADGKPQDQKSDAQQARSGAAEPRKMTQEEAQRLLQLIRDKERQRRQEQAQQVIIQQVPVERDW